MIILSWNDIGTISFFSNSYINIIIDVIKQQIKLWFPNIKTNNNLCILNDKVQFIIGFLCYKANHNITQIKETFIRLGKYIYIKYGYYIENIDSNPNNFIGLLNSNGLNLNINLLNKYIIK